MNEKKNEKKFKDSFLTRNETARYFGISRQCTYNWERQGLLDPVFKFGKTYFRISDIEPLDTEKQWLTITEALKYLGISRATLWRAEQDDKIKCVKRPGKLKEFRKDDLDKL